MTRPIFALGSARVDMPASHRLRTPRLFLAPAAETDVYALARHWSDRQVRQFLWDDHPVGVGTVREVVAASELTFARAGYGIWTVRAPTARGDRRKLWAA